MNAFRSELRSERFPAPAAKTLAETGAPTWAVEAFDRLRTANGGTLRGFFDVFAWREPGQVRLAEAKADPDRIKPTQLRSIELALRFHRSEQFMITEVAGPSLRGEAGRRPKSAWEAVERDTRRPTADKLRSNRQGLLRRTAGDLLRMLDQVGGPDEPERGWRCPTSPQLSRRDGRAGRRDDGRARRGSLLRQPGRQLPGRSAELLDLGRERRPGVLPAGMRRAGTGMARQAAQSAEKKKARARRGPGLRCGAGSPS